MRTHTPTYSNQTVEDKDPLRELVRLLINVSLANSPSIQERLHLHAPCQRQRYRQQLLKAIRKSWPNVRKSSHIRIRSRLPKTLYAGLAPSACSTCHSMICQLLSTITQLPTATYNKHKCRCDERLNASKQETQNGHASEILCTCCSDKYTAPCNDRNADKTPDWKLLRQQCRWIFADKIAKVEEGR